MNGDGAIDDRDRTITGRPASLPFADFPDDAYAARVQDVLDRNPGLLACLTGSAHPDKRCTNIAP